MKPLDAFAWRGKYMHRPNSPHHGLRRRDTVCKPCLSHSRHPALQQVRAERATRAAAGVKQCGTCRRDLPFADFAIRRASRDGLSYKCRSCSRRTTADFREAHPDHNAKHYAQNREHNIARAKRWAETNKDRKRATRARWQAENPERFRAQWWRRSQKKRDATPTWVDYKAINAVYDEALRLTAETGIPHEVDHIVPLNHPEICGLHVPWNLQVLTAIENQRKHNRFTPTLTLKQP